MTTKAMPKNNFKQTEIGEIPADWDLKALRSVCVETTTINPAKNPNTIIEYVDVSSVSREGCRIVAPTKYAGKDAPGRARNLVRHHDVIFATVRPTLRRVALVPKELDGQVVSTAFCVIRAEETQAHPEYLYYVVSSPDFVARVGRLERGASYPAVTDNNIFTQKIALPSWPEQERIAKVLSKIQRTVESQEKRMLDLRELKAATLAKLFHDGLRGEPLKETEIGDIPQSWEIRALTRCCEKPQYGYTESSSEKQIGPKFLRITDLTEDGVDWGDVPYCKCNEDDFKKHQLKTGDILVARIGATTGKNHLIQSCPDAVFASYLIRLRAKAGLAPEFLSNFMDSSIYWTQVRATKGQNLKGGMSGAILSQIVMPFPSEPEQKEIAAAIGGIAKSLNMAVKRYAELKLLFSSTLNQLMTGRARVY